MNVVAEPVVAEPSVEKSKAVAMICSIFPNGEKSVTMQRSYRGFTVNICQEGEPFALTQIEPATAYADLGESKFNNVSKKWSRRQEYHYTAREVAADLCREQNSNVMGVQHSYLGFFICAGLEPTPQELAKETEKLKAFLFSLTKEATKQWSAKPVHDLVPNVARRAAKYLHLDFPWLLNSDRMDKCPACSTAIPEGAAVCPNCTAIIDEQKARQFFPERFAPKEPRATQK